MVVNGDGQNERCVEVASRADVFLIPARRSIFDILDQMLPVRNLMASPKFSVAMFDLVRAAEGTPFCHSSQVNFLMSLIRRCGLFGNNFGILIKDVSFSSFIVNSNVYGWE